MSSVHTETLDPRPPSKHASLPPSSSRLAHVTSAAPAKRITFYKSGDSQFEGVRMAVHKRSFKCFDALLDDLSQKVPLPFGVRTVTTPRGTHTIKHLEQLQDGGCYLCSDQRQHSRRPHRPESSKASPGHAHLPYRQRRILLVSNMDPGLRRSVLLSRRSTRSLGTFLEEASQLMQFHVRKLYTSIDNVQTLITYPSVLICVGREAFSPTLVENPCSTRSKIIEKSPSNDPFLFFLTVNFGLETKKSIIHPRSDSSTRSTRFSLSSDKSYGVGSAPQARPAIMNDDIEKRVVVNKDGTLSVEMRVRFRLQSDETLQWSTQIKKSPSLTNDCCALSQATARYLQQGQSESCSDLDSTSVDHCPCCYPEPEPKYDLWENPVHRHIYPPQPPPRSSSHTHTITRHSHSSSSSSSRNSRRVMRCRARLSSGKSGSGSELMQEQMCVTEQVERRVEVEQDGNTHVEVCKVSHSRSELIAVDGAQRPLSGKSEQERMRKEDEEVSAISSSSRILQSLKEDQDNNEEDDDLPPSASQCCHNNEESPAPTPEPEMTNRAASGISTEHQEAGSRAASSLCCRATMLNLSSKGKIPKSAEDECEVKRAVGGLSGSSKRFNMSSVCLDCGGCRRSEAESNLEDVALPASPNDLEGRASSAVFKISDQESAKEEERTRSTASVASRKSSQYEDDTEKRSCSGKMSPKTQNKETKKERPTSSLSAKSGASATTVASIRSHKSRAEAEDTDLKDDDKRASSGLSVKTNASSKSEKDERSDGAPSAQSYVSGKSGTSHRSTCSQYAEPAQPAKGQESNNRPISATSNSNLSVKSNKCRKSTKASDVSLSPRPEAEPDVGERVASQKSGKSCKSSNSVKCDCNEKAVEMMGNDVEMETQKMPVGDEMVLSTKSDSCEKSCHINTEVNGIEERASSAISQRSQMSAKSRGSQKANHSSIVVSRKSSRRGPADITVTDTAEEKMVSNATLSPRRARSHRSSVSPSGSAVGKSKASSDVSVQTPISGKSGRDKCDCGAASEKTEKEEENDKVSILSCSSQSVSLGLPEDQDTAESESGKSNVSSNTNNEDKEQDGVKTAASTKSTKSHRSDVNSVKNPSCPNVPLMDIPTIQMPEGGAEECEVTNTPRVASAITVKSSKSSHKSLCNCSNKRPAGSDVSSENQDNSKTAKKEKEAESVASARSETKSKASKRSKAESGNKGFESPKIKTAVESLKECPNQTNGEACSESTVSAADLLKETVARPRSRQSNASRTSHKPQSESSRSCQKKRNLTDHEEALPTPDCLPNASPSEVVSDWLRSIPANSSMLAPDEVFDEEHEEEPQGERVTEEQEASPEDTTEREGEVEPAEEDKAGKKDPGALPTSSATLPKNWPSSAAVMKVLLSSSPGRCRSMPEVSARLSSSAQGLLDCLAQLQLIGPTLNPCCEQLKECHQQYEDIMAILHSLWLTEPKAMEKKEAKAGVAEVTSPMSSSGVGMSSGSNGSGKDNGNQETDEMPSHKKTEKEAKDEDPEDKKTPNEKAMTEEPEPSTDPCSLDSQKAMENPSTSDKSSSKSPSDNEQDSSSGTPPTVLRATLSKKMSQDPDPAWVLHLLKKLEKQFMGHYTDAMVEFKVRWDLDDSLLLERMICELKDEVGRRIQKSIEREIKKIQSRVWKGGRSPRPPPGGNLSRESTTTEKRRWMLKVRFLIFFQVMKNQSVKTADTHNVDDLTDDFSDQRSDDEYCPCDACVRKKMAARPLKENPLAPEAPMVMEFDLLKILQQKKSPVTAPPIKQQTEEEEEKEEEQEDSEVEKEERSLEIVQEEEEEEETKEDKEEEAESKDEEDSVEEEEKGESSEKEEEDEEVECHCHAKTEEINEEDQKEKDEEEGTGSGEDEEEEENESTIDTVREATPRARDTLENTEDDEDPLEDEHKVSESQPEEEDEEERNMGLMKEDEDSEGEGEETTSAKVSLGF
uniref:Doublecortin domain-containing protein n=1 Tax=Gouania willdenowi TaxID=441366 RepID=A0A8C5DML3_GOUWI